MWLWKETCHVEPQSYKNPIWNWPLPPQKMIVLQTITWRVLRRALFPSGNKVYPNSNRVSNNTVLIWKSHFLPWLPKSLGQEEQDFYLQFWASLQSQMARTAPLRKKEPHTQHSLAISLSIVSFAQCVFLFTEPSSQPWVCFKSGQDKLSWVRPDDWNPRVWGGSQAL